MTQDNGPRMTQMVVQGMNNPALFTFALILNFLLLGATLMMCAWVLSGQNHVYTELRILQEQYSRTNSILIQAGIVRPGEDRDHDPQQHR